jgi:hypothetical protein
MLQSIKKTSNNPSPRQQSPALEEDNENIFRVDSPCPLPENNFILPNNHLNEIGMSTPNPQQNFKNFESEKKMKKVTLDNYLNKNYKKERKMSMIEMNTDQLAKSFHPNIHYSNLNINMSNNKTTFYNNDQRFGHGGTPQSMMINNFQAPLNHYMAMPNFNIVNSPRGLFNDQTKINLESKNMNNENINHHCSEHQMNADLICLTDRTIICTNCALFGVHKGHNYMKLEDFINQCKSKLKEIISYSKDDKLLKFMSGNKENISKIQNKIHSKKEELFSKVENILEKMIQKLRVQEKEAKMYISKQFENFESSINQLNELRIRNKSKYEELQNRINKIEMTLNSKIPDLSFLLDNLILKKDFTSKTMMESIMKEFMVEEKKIIGVVEKELFKYQIEPRKSLSKEIEQCFVQISYLANSEVKTPNKKKLSTLKSKQVLKQINQKNKINKQTSLTKNSELNLQKKKTIMKNSVNFSLEKEFEDFQFNLELNKRLNQQSRLNSTSKKKLMSQHVSKENINDQFSQKIQIYTESEVSDEREQYTEGNEVEFDPVNMMGMNNREQEYEQIYTDSEEISNELADNPQLISRSNTFKNQIISNVNKNYKKSEIILKRNHQNKSIKFLQGMKNKTKNFELMIKNQGKERLKKSMRHHKSHKNINPKFNELINFSENMIHDKIKNHSGNKRKTQNDSNVRFSGMLTGYLSDRNVKDQPLISQFNDYSQVKNLEFLRKSSAHNFQNYKLNR